MRTLIFNLKKLHDVDVGDEPDMKAIDAVEAETQEKLALLMPRLEELMKDEPGITLKPTGLALYFKVQDERQQKILLDVFSDEWSHVVMHTSPFAGAAPATPTLH